MSKKRLTLAVTVSVPDWMTKTQARREVRTLINDQCNWLCVGPDGQQVETTTVRAVSVKAPERPKAKITHRIRPCKGNRSAWILIRLHEDGTEDNSFGSYVTALSIDELLQRAGHMAPGRDDVVQITSNR